MSIPHGEPLLVDTSSEDTPGSRLLRAAECGTLESVRKALEDGASPMAFRDNDGPVEDALLIAINSNPDQAVAAYLIEIGLHRMDRSHLTEPLPGPLARRGWGDLLDLIVEMGGYPLDKQDIQGRSGLMVAASLGDASAVEVLLDRRADHSLIDENSCTALHHAKTGQVAKLLLDAGANIESQEIAGRTPLILAAENGNVDVIQELTAHGANLEAVDQAEDTPLLAAVTYYGQDATKALLDAGANIEAKNHKKETPLIVAARSGHQDLVVELFARGANLEATDANGATALTSAVRSYEANTAVQLLELGANIEAANAERMTPLHTAAGRDDLSFVTILLARGTNLEARTWFGDTPLLYAAKSGAAQALATLLEAGADVSARDNAGHGIDEALEKHPDAKAAYGAWRAQGAMKAAISRKPRDTPRLA